MIVTRFAPSPTGLLHVGHAYAALVASDAARDGRFIVRIEDIDLARSREEYIAAIDEDLSWLGLKWERPVRRQSQHFAEYTEALDRLDTRGLLYPCFCTRKEIAEEVANAVSAPHGPDGPLYPGTCRAISESKGQARMKRGEPYALRLDVLAAKEVSGVLRFQEWGEGPNGETGEQVVRPDLFGDVVLARKDMPASYHLAVVVDDARQGVTVVTRGNDLFPAAHVQRLLQSLLGLPTPAYQHHGLVRDGSGQKLSKRDNAMAIRAFRESGMSPAEVKKMIGFTSR